MTEMMTYTIVGIVLYFGSDWILQKLEQSAGKRFEHRNILFFVIIMVLALFSFTLIRIFIPAS